MKGKSKEQAENEYVETARTVLTKYGKGDLIDFWWMIIYHHKDHEVNASYYTLNNKQFREVYLSKKLLSKHFKKS